MIVYPSYYNEFCCIASRCRHNCCIGWEIDIDPDTLARYDGTSGPFGQRLVSSISRDGAPHFLLGEGGRCPFLNGENLCDVILSLGEGALCQICRDHPRFRNELPGRTEVGLGLACEEAGRIILAQKTPMGFVCEGDAGEPDPDEEELLGIRDGFFRILWDTSRPFSERTREILAESEARHVPIGEATRVMQGLEMLDNEWGRLLAHLPDREPRMDGGYEPLLEYFLYRHLPAAYDDGDIPSKVGFAELAARVIAALDEAFGDSMPERIEHARLFSGEIEYSGENTDALYDLFI